MRKSRKKASVNAKRWAAYAAAGAAAALGPQSAEADITLVEPNAQLRDGAPGDGYFDAAFAATFGNPGAALVFNAAYSETAAGEGVLTLIGSVSASAPASFAVSFAGSANGAYFYPGNLAYGQNVSTLGMVSAGNRGDMAWGQGYANSQFLDTGGFIGFSFDIGNGTQFGWAELQLDAGVPQNLFTLVRYAFADPGESIFVGQVPTAIPEPGSLGLLAMGAAGLVAWRRKRKVA